MADLIDRQELKKRYITTAQSGGYVGDAMSIVTNHLTRLLRLIDEAPTVEPKKGEWVRYDDNKYVVRCPICTKHQLDATNYCPNCGADMRGKDNA